MTGELPNKKRYLRILSKNPAHVVLGLLGILALLLVIKNADVAIACMSKGISLCVRTVVPSLFPFMVISEIIVSSGATSIIGRPLRTPFRYLFGISENGSVPILLGILCGFPVGAKSAASLYKKGLIKRSEFERILAFCNTPSSAFLINAVGISMFYDKSLGIALYVTSIVSSLLVGLFFNIFKKRKEDPVDSTEIEPTDTTKADPPARIFSNAITSSAASMLNVCAFVLFFSAFMGTLEYFLSAIQISDAAKAVIFSFFELTGGIKKASSLTRGGALIAAFAAGWSGLSVHFQIMSLSYYEGVSFKPYFLSKAVQGILNILFIWICLSLGIV